MSIVLLLRPAQTPEDMQTSPAYIFEAVPQVFTRKCTTSGTNCCLREGKVEFFFSGSVPSEQSDRAHLESRVPQSVAGFRVNGHNGSFALLNSLLKRFFLEYYTFFKLH